MNIDLMGTSAKLVPWLLMRSIFVVKDPYVLVRRYIKSLVKLRILIGAMMKNVTQSLPYLARYDNPAGG